MECEASETLAPIFFICPRIRGSPEQVRDILYAACHTVIYIRGNHPVAESSRSSHIPRPPRKFQTFPSHWAIHHFDACVPPPRKYSRGRNSTMTQSRGNVLEASSRSRRMSDNQSSILRCDSSSKRQEMVQVQCNRPPLLSPSDCRIRSVPQREGPPPSVPVVFRTSMLRLTDRAIERRLTRLLNGLMVRLCKFSSASAETSFQPSAAVVSLLFGIRYSTAVCKPLQDSCSTTTSIVPIGRPRQDERFLNAKCTCRLCINDTASESDCGDPLSEEADVVERWDFPVAIEDSATSDAAEYRATVVDNSSTFDEEVNQLLQYIVGHHGPALLLSPRSARGIGSEVPFGLAPRHTESFWLHLAPAAPTRARDSNYIPPHSISSAVGPTTDGGNSPNPPNNFSRLLTRVGGVVQHFASKATEATSDVFSAVRNELLPEVLTNPVFNSSFSSLSTARPGSEFL